MYRPTRPTSLLPIRRSRLAAVVAAAVVLGVAPGPATAGETVETWMPALHVGLDCQTKPENPRSWIAKVYGRFRDVPGITHATIFYQDDHAGRVRQAGGYPPFHDNHVAFYFQHIAPAGFHDLQIASRSGTRGNLAPEGCPLEDLEPWAAGFHAFRVRIRTEQPVATCDGRTAMVVGGPGPDTLLASDHADLPAPIVFHGLGGDDTIVGDSGVATIQCGGGGRDRLTGGSKADRLFGQRGPDTLAGRGGRPDHCDGGPGRDARGKGCEMVVSIP